MRAPLLGLVKDGTFAEVSRSGGEPELSGAGGSSAGGWHAKR